MRLFVTQKLILGLLLFGLISCANKTERPVKQKKTVEDFVSPTQTKIELKIPAKKYTFDNGLKLLVVENHKLPIFSYYTFVDVGGRHEGKGTTGATHFLEHMMFKGSKKYGPKVFDTYIEKNGGKTNAYTTFDSTVYYESLPSHALEEIVKMEADRLDNILLIPESVESERAVVFEERKLRYENRPEGKIYLSMMQAVFEKTPYGGSVIGEESDLRALTRENLLSFHKTFYRPNNIVIVIVGDVDSDDVYDLIKKNFGSMKASEDLVKKKSLMDDESKYAHRGRYKREIRLHGQNPTPKFMLAYKGEKLGTRNSFVMDILSSVLGDGRSSFFQQKYVYGKYPGLNSISVGNYTLKYNGVFYIMGELRNGHSLNKFKKRIKKDLKSVCEKAINERSLQKTKNQYFVDFFNSAQTNSGVAHMIGMRENFYGDHTYYQKEIEIYNSITVKELKDSCKNVFDGDKSIFLSIWNKHPKKGKKK